MSAVRRPEPASAGHAKPCVATFWHGPALARLDVACLLSFVHAGFEIVVYGYERIVGLPADIEFRDAAEVVDPTYLEAFVFGGKPSLSHFSDLFRYRLFAATGQTWVDTDLLCLKPFAIPAGRDFIARESADRISSSILRIEPDRPELATLICEAERIGRTRDFEWGSTGPTLLTRTFGAAFVDEAYEPFHFFPVPWDEWWKPFTPSARDECDAACRDASAIHLWNNIVERSGYWKDLAPPVGSYLHAVLARSDSLGLFREVCPADVMEHIATNYRRSRTAEHLTVPELVGITVPRIAAGVRKRFAGKRR